MYQKQKQVNLLKTHPLPRIKEDQEEETIFRDVVSFNPDPLPGEVTKAPTVIIAPPTILPPFLTVSLCGPARYYDKDTTRPTSFYFSSLEDLLAWTPIMEDGFNVALEPLERRQPPLSSPRPRTLLCHDMMGGYLEDR